MMLDVFFQPVIAFALVIGLALVAVAGVVYLALRLRIRQQTPGLPVSEQMRLECSVCHTEMAFSGKQVRLIDGPELALAISARPELYGHRVGELRCGHCGASHCFIARHGRLQWAGANLFRPESGATHCVECKRVIVAPPWPRGHYDGRLAEAPELRPEYGLQCPFCKGICCVSCCQEATRNRTKDKTLLCPRCFRGPVDVVFHPSKG